MDSSTIVNNDLNSQIFNYNESNDIKQKHSYIFYITISICILQIIFLMIWYYIYYYIKLMKTAYKKYLMKSIY